MTRLPVHGRLAILEEDDRVLVVVEGDPGDWLCAFTKTGGFPARHWAEQMVQAYNSRARSPGAQYVPEVSCPVSAIKAKRNAVPTIPPTIEETNR